MTISRVVAPLVLFAACAAAQPAAIGKLPAHVKLVPGLREAAIRGNILPRLVTQQQPPPPEFCAAMKTMPADGSIDPGIARKAKAPEPMPAFEGQAPCAASAEHR